MRNATTAASTGHVSTAQVQPQTVPRSAPWFAPSVAPAIASTAVAVPLAIAILGAGNLDVYPAAAAIAGGAALEQGLVDRDVLNCNAISVSTKAAAAVVPRSVFDVKPEPYER